MVVKFDVKSTELLPLNLPHFLAEMSADKFEEILMLAEFVAEMSAVEFCWKCRPINLAEFAAEMSAVQFWRNVRRKCQTLKFWQTLWPLKFDGISNGNVGRKI